jgi:hypothetical protein
MHGEDYGFRNGIDLKKLLPTRYPWLEVLIPSSFMQHLKEANMKHVILLVGGVLSRIVISEEASVELV